MQSELISASERVARWRRRVWDAIQTARTAAVFLEASAALVSTDGEHLVTSGWYALHHADYGQAQRYFRAALHYDPYAVSAWVGLSRATSIQEERRAYLQMAFDLQYLVASLERTCERRTVYGRPD